MRLRIILLTWVTVRFVVNACTRPVSTPRMQQALSEAQPVSPAPFGPPGSLAGSAESLSLTARRDRLSVVRVAAVLMRPWQ